MHAYIYIHVAKIALQNQPKKPTWLGPKTLTADSPCIVSKTSLLVTAWYWSHFPLSKCTYESDSEIYWSSWACAVGKKLDDQQVSTSDVRWKKEYCIGNQASHTNVVGVRMTLQPHCGMGIPERTSFVRSGKRHWDMMHAAKDEWIRQSVDSRVDNTWSTRTELPGSKLEQ